MGLQQFRLLVDSQVDCPIRSAMLAEFRVTIARLLRQRCRKQAQQIMILRYGIESDSLTYSVEETAKVLGLNCRRVRSIEGLTISKLQFHPELLSIL